MRGELDWIVMKALEKDRTRRYESASGLASDVERYLHDEPVEAGPPSARYRLRKLARRYRRGLLVAGAFALLLVAGAAVSAWEAYQARRAEQAAVQDRDRAVSAEQAASREQARASAAEVGAVAAKEQTQDALAASLYEQARAVRLSGLPGRRWRVLELLKKSEHLRSRERPDPSRLPGKEQLADQHEFLSRAQLRSEAVAALLLEDAHVVRQWSGMAHSVSPDGNLAATEWVDAKTGAVALEITDLKTGQGISKWEGDDAMPFIGTAIALGPNGKRMAVVMPPMPIGGRKVSSGGINVWELSGRTLLRELSLPKQGGDASQTNPPTAKAGAMELPFLARAIIPSLRFSPNGRYVCGVTASIAGNRVVVWDLKGDGTGHVAGNVLGLASAAFNPDSSLLALASSEKKVVLWNTVRNRVEREIQLPLESTGAVGFAPDGSLGITCAPPKPGSRPNGEQTLLIWDLAQNREIKRITSVPNATTGISFSPDGTHVAMGSGSVGSILVFDLTGANAAISLEHQFALQLLAWTHDSRRLLSGGFGSLKMWQFSDESLLSDLQLEVEPGASFQGPLAFSPNGRFIAIEGRESGHVDIYDRTTRKRVWHLPNDASDKLPALRLLFSPDEKQLVRLGLVSVDVWIVETGTRQSRLIANPSQGQMFESVGLRADGTVVVGALESVLNVGSGKVIWRAPSGSGSAVNVSSDGRFATTCLSVTAGNQEPYSLVDLNTGKSRFQFVGPPPTPMTTYEFSPDSRWLLVLHIEGLAGAGPASAGSMLLGSGTGERKWTSDVWDVQSGKRHMQVGGPSDPESYAFSRDGEYLAVGMTTGAFRVWETNRREELFDWHPFGDHPASPIISHYLAFATDDACLAVPSPISPAFQILNLRNANKQLGKAALSW
jgi:WD40 repeat protein